MSKNESSFLDKYFSGQHKKAIGIILIIAAILVIGVIVWGAKKSKQKLTAEQVSAQTGEFQPGIVYYYGQACPRCKNVDKFLADEKIEEKISFTKKDILLDPSNDMEMRERATECGLDRDKVGIPFLWAKDKCYIGEVEVEKFLKEEIKNK